MADFIGKVSMIELRVAAHPHPSSRQGQSRQQQQQNSVNWNGLTERAGAVLQRLAFFYFGCKG